ncbi:hypothetical protein G7054_g1885 [Neopestalotiopsis clavispora]|nr:hypothetical protein G7054_g1885 [Neopestalotiopsis clavispora]
MASPSVAAANAQLSDAVKHDDQKFMALLHEFCMSDDISALNSLQEKGVDSKAVHENGMTALHLACGFGKLKIVQQLLSQCETNMTESAEALTIDAHLNVNAKDNFGQTPLHLAALGGHEEIVKEFIKEPKCKFDALDDDGWTPLMSATKRGHAAIVRLLLRKSSMNIPEKGGETPLMVALHRNDLEIVELIWTYSCQTSPPSPDITDKVLSWASENFQRHHLADSILSRNSLNEHGTACSSPIERAALLGKSKVLWWLIASSPHDLAINCVERAKHRLKLGPWQSDTHQRTAEAQFVTKSRGKNGNAITILPTCQHLSYAHTDNEVMSEILDILYDPPFQVAFRQSPLWHIPEPEELTKDYRAHIREFFKNQSGAGSIGKISSVEDAVYRRGPAKIMKEKLQTEKQYMVRSQEASITSELYNEGNRQFTWIHLPATRIDWMEHLAQKIVSAETGPIHGKFSEIESFLQGTCIQIPEGRLPSRIMKPGFQKRWFGRAVKAENKLRDQRESKVDDHVSGAREQEITNNEDYITCSATYSSAISDAIPVFFDAPGSTSPLQANEPFERFPEEYPVVHPVVHGCPTLHEAYYHFATDKLEEKFFDHPQVVSMQLGEAESKVLDPGVRTDLRVRWLISACSHPVDDVEELWIDGFIDHLQKDARVKGGLSQPNSASEMIEKMTTYCVGSYERKRTYENLSSSINRRAEKENGNLTYGLPIRQLFWNYSNTMRRKEESLFLTTDAIINGLGIQNKLGNALHSREVAGRDARYIFRDITLIHGELEILQWIAECQELVQSELFEAAATTSNMTVDYVLRDMRKMKQHASRTQENVNFTMSLLQNEIATSQTQESLSQGRILMVFTVLTILFLPMSFLTSLFAMDADKLSTNPTWSFGVIGEYQRGFDSFKG